MPTKPPADYVADPGHALCPTLAFLYQETSGEFTREKVTGLANAILQPGATFGRLGLEMPGSGYTQTTYPVGSVSDTPFLGALTLVWIGQFDALSGYRHLMGKHTGGGGAACPFDFHLNAARPELVRANSDYRHWASSGSTVAVDTPVILGVVAASTIQTMPTFYINSTGAGATSGGGGGTGAATGNGAPLLVGLRYDSFAQLDGTIESVLLYNRALTAPEWATLVSDPYAWLTAPAGGGGGGTFARIFTGY